MRCRIVFHAACFHVRIAKTLNFESGFTGFIGLKRTSSVQVRGLLVEGFLFLMLFDDALPHRFSRGVFPCYNCQNTQFLNQILGFGVNIRLNLSVIRRSITSPVLYSYPPIPTLVPILNRSLQRRCTHRLLFVRTQF